MIVRVHKPDHGVSVLEIVTPQRTNLVTPCSNRNCAILMSG
jgi:hypothetical protein